MSKASRVLRDEAWPSLPLDAWADTCHTLHMWLQIVGKIRLGLTPLQNHWWNSTLYLTSRGLTTSPISWHGGAFEIHLDFIDHRLELVTSAGRVTRLELRAQPVCAFYAELMSALQSEGIAVSINTKPQEVPDPVPFGEDDVHRSYDPDYVNRMWRILLSTSQVFEDFRARFVGKASPVHFFWGSFDLAYTRFSGRRAPPRKGVISAEAYACECSSVGWWPGSGEVKDPAFYAYTVAEPAGLAASRVGPARAFYHPSLHEFVLMYDDVREAAAPAADLLEFCERTYGAGAELADWDRNLLEC